MTPALRDHLTNMTDKQRDRMRRDSQESLRFSWSHRYTLRGRTVVRSNVTMLRNLRAIG